MVNANQKVLVAKDPRCNGTRRHALGGRHAVKDEKDAIADGMIIGSTMWAVVMMAGPGSFIILIIGSINYLSHNVNWMSPKKSYTGEGRAWGRPRCEPYAIVAFSR